MAVLLPVRALRGVVRGDGLADHPPRGEVVDGASRPARAIAPRTATTPSVAGASSPPSARISGASCVVTVGQTVSPLRKLAPARPAPARHRRAGVPGEQDGCRGRRHRGARSTRPTPSRSCRTARRPAILHARRARRAAAPHRDAADRLRRGMERQQARGPGVSVRDVLDAAGVDRRHGRRSSRCSAAGATAARSSNAAQVDDADTMLATHVEGEPLHVDHGFPLRLIAPNRPGVLQTKWVVAAGGVVSGDTETSRRATQPRRARFVAAPWSSGGLVIAFGVRSCARATPATPTRSPSWSTSSLFDLGHDLIVAPVVTRRRPRHRQARCRRSRAGPVRSATAATALFVLFSYPLVATMGASSDELLDAAARVRAQPRHRRRRHLGDRRGRDRPPRATLAVRSGWRVDAPAVAVTTAAVSAHRRMAHAMARQHWTPARSATARPITHPRSVRRSSGVRRCVTRRDERRARTRPAAAVAPRSSSVRLRSSDATLATAGTGGSGSASSPPAASRSRSSWRRGGGWFWTLAAAVASALASAVACDGLRHGARAHRRRRRPAARGRARDGVRRRACPSLPPAGEFVRTFVERIDDYSVHVRGHPPGLRARAEAAGVVGSRRRVAGGRCWRCSATGALVGAVLVTAVGGGGRGVGAPGRAVPRRRAVRRCGW